MNELEEQLTRASLAIRPALGAADDLIVATQSDEVRQLREELWQIAIRLDAIAAGAQRIARREQVVESSFAHLSTFDPSVTRREVERAVDRQFANQGRTGASWGHAATNAVDQQLASRVRREQVIDFACGNLAIDDPSVTRESVERAYERVYGGDA